MYSTMMQERPTSCPAPSGVILTTAPPSADSDAAASRTSNSSDALRLLAIVSEKSVMLPLKSDADP
jgi:hypothetical protein